jgi:hypothetical protein
LVIGKFALLGLWFLARKGGLPGINPSAKVLSAHAGLPMIGNAIHYPSTPASDYVKRHEVRRALHTVLILPWLHGDRMAK